MREIFFNSDTLFEGLYCISEKYGGYYKRRKHKWVVVGILQDLLSSPSIQSSFLGAMRFSTTMCSGSVVVTAYDFESSHPGSNPEWGPIYYKASITAQGLPEPSSLWGSTLGTKAAEHKGCNWGMQID